MFFMRNMWSIAKHPLGKNSRLTPIAGITMERRLNNFPLLLFALNCHELGGIGGNLRQSHPITTRIGGTMAATWSHTGASRQRPPSHRSALER